MDIQASIECVQLVPIFRQLDETAVRAIAALVRDHTYQAREQLFTAGTDADTLVIIARGQVKVTQSTASGREQLLRLLQLGDFDGEAVLFTPTERTTTATALTAVQACTISRQDFQHLLQATPPLALNVLNALGQRVVRLEAQATAANTTSVAARLANYLVETSAGMGHQAFDLPLPKKDLAAYLGTTPETVSRKLAEFSTRGWITQTGRRHIAINNSDALLTVE
ncbi:Crp/Fnr family transcriptional regulator [Lacticaseibacillus thailandensis]|nr:Crp/Fnr family transcriptional regulator [Lacticaseibacillus thailandensis]